VGAIFEGETILVVAGLAIHAGYLHCTCRGCFCAPSSARW
jgi:hypothetical protein